MGGFALTGTDADGLEAEVSWDEERGFGGDPALITEIERRIADEEYAGLTAEGPFFQAADDEFEAAYATALAVFRSVESVEMNGFKVPSYRGGVIQPGEESVVAGEFGREFAGKWTPSLHPRWPKGSGPKAGKFMTKGEIASMRRSGGTPGKTKGGGFEIEIKDTRHGIESRMTAAGERQVVIDQKTGKVLGIYKTHKEAYEHWKRLEGDPEKILGGAGGPPEVKDPNSEGAIDCGKDVEKAARLLAEGKAVQLRQPRQVSVLLEKLADIVHDAEAKGETAPDYDLCKVTVKGTSLFCTESKGILRKMMPQLKGKPIPGSEADKLPRDKRGEVDVTKAFMAHLRKKGISMKKGKEHAAYMKATQNQLDGQKVAGMTRAARKGDFDPSLEQLLITEEGYIVDGHHRWAALVALDAEDNRLGNDKTIPVIRAGMDIVELLYEANVFTKEIGIPQQGITEGRTGNAKV